MAFSQPYTYGNLQKDLTNIESLPNSSRCLHKEILCYTILGNPCYLLTITSPSKGKDKKGVVFTGRVHPGETVSSWMIKGVIEFLLEDSLEARLLRESFVFKIVPMLNPDGVINGNYRCSLAGCDLNRKYKNASKILTPTIYYLKKMVHEFSKAYPIVLYCDFHGHSKKKDVFLYGNTDGCNEAQYRIYPYIMSKVSPYIDFSKCNFGVQKSKLSTARIVIWKELNIYSVYTIEASFFGPSSGEGKHFSVEDYINIGKTMCQALLIYKNIHKNERVESFGTKFLKQSIKNTIDFNRVTEEIANDLENHKELLFNNIGDKIKDRDIGSDSDPSGDNLDLKELLKIVPREIKRELITEVKSISHKREHAFGNATILSQKKKYSIDEYIGMADICFKKPM